MRIAKAHV